MVLGTIAKAGAVLDAFDDREEWGTRDLAVRLGLPRSGVHDLLTSLTAIGLLQRTEQGRYRLGWRVLELAGGVGEAAVLRQVAPRHLRSLADRGGATVHLAVWDGREMFFFARAVAPGGLVVERARPGVRLPGHATGSGRVFLAHRPWPEARAWLAVDGGAVEGLAAVTPATTTDEATIRAALEAVRREGIAVVRDEVVMGVGQLAVPVWGAGDRVAAALGISLRTEDVDGWLARHRDQLDGTAAALTAALRGAVASAARDAIRGLVLEV